MDYGSLFRSVDIHFHLIDVSGGQEEVSFVVQQTGNGIFPSFKRHFPIMP